ncbi:MAG: phenazine biosynthesis protein PhzF [bacterium]|nr:MAG: phenazine biosynthesis protein PhzF [bacterium]
MTDSLPPCEVVRVFTNTGKNGNGLAVFPDARGFGKPFMQAIAAKLGYSETSFVLPPTMIGADYRVRFFTPKVEIEFAGHPSIGTLWALRRSGKLKIKKNYVQQIGKRAVKITVLPDGRIKMDQGRPTFSSGVSSKTAARLLSLEPGQVTGSPMVASTGNPHLIIPLRNIKALREASIRMPVYKRMVSSGGAPCVMPFAVYRSRTRCRMFAPALGIVEDPATGSGVGPLAAYLVRRKLAGCSGDVRCVVEVRQGVGPPALSLLYAWVENKGGKILRVEVGGFCIAG